MTNPRDDIRAFSEHQKNPSAEIDRLAKLSIIDYERERKDAANRLGIGRVSALDKVVEEQQRKASADTQSKGPAEDEPWQTPVALDHLLERLTERMRAHVAFTENQALVVALWEVFTWTHDAFTHSPQLLVTSPEANSGKSTLLGLVVWLAKKGLPLINPTPAVLYRIIEAWHPTLICDEADDQFKDNSDLRSVFNSGWTRGSGVPRCHPETNAPEIFPTFAPKALGMKGRRIPDTTLSRCIVIGMKRKKPGTGVRDFNHLDDDGLADARRMMARWAEDNLDALKTAEPVMPEGFENRLRANWKPLLAIAEMAGADWAERAGKAAVELSPIDQGSIGTTLLADIKTIFEETDRDRLSGEDIVEKLHTMEDRPWAEWGRTQKPISKIQLAYQLKEFGVCPDQIRFGDKTLKGYAMVAFEEAWERYLTPSPPPETPSPPQTPLSNSKHRNKCDEIRGSATFQLETPNDNVSSWKCEKPNNDGICFDVSSQNPPSPVGRVCEVCGKPDLPGSPLVEAAISGVTSFGHETCIVASAAPKSNGACGPVHYGNGYNISRSPEDRLPPEEGHLATFVTIREVRPDDPLDDPVAIWGTPPGMQP